MFNWSYQQIYHPGHSSWVTILLRLSRLAEVVTLVMRKYWISVKLHIAATWSLSIGNTCLIHLQRVFGGMSQEICNTMGDTSPCPLDDGRSLASIVTSSILTKPPRSVVCSGRGRHVKCASFCQMRRETMASWGAHDAVYTSRHRRDVK